MREFLRRNALVAMLAMVLIGCAHAANDALVWTIPDWTIAAAMGMLAITIVVVLDIISAVTARTSWLFSLVAALAALMIVGCRNVAMLRDVESTAALFIIVAGIVAAVCAAAQIADDLDRKELVLIAPFVGELIALTRLLTDGAYDGIIIASSGCVLVAFVSFAAVSAPQRAEIKNL